MTLASHLDTKEAQNHALPSACSASEDFTRSKVNIETIAIERSKARFDINAMAHVIDGGKEKTEVRWPREGWSPPTNTSSCLCAFLDPLVSNMYRR